MFGKILLISALALIAWAVVARASHGAGPEVRYTVKPGDTLWAIAAKNYAGDPRDAIYRINRRNHLAGSLLVPGQRLLCPQPARGERFDRPPEPGFARREAHCARNGSNSALLRRLLKPKYLAAAGKEGAHGGTRGSPMLGACLFPASVFFCPQPGSGRPAV